MNKTLKLIIKFIFMRSYRRELLHREMDGCTEIVSNGMGGG